MDLPEVLKTIQDYIKARKNVDIIISPILPDDIPKIIFAYNIALEWFELNKEE